jgi:hypothetical protein
MNEIKKQKIVLFSPGSSIASYTVVENIGKGSYSLVYKVTKGNDKSNFFVMKQLQRMNISD